MKIINGIYLQLQNLTWLAVRILQATNCIFCITLLSALAFTLFPDIASDPVNAALIADELLHASTRLLTLGIISAFASDIAVRI